MRELIVILVLYGAVLFGFGWLGGMRAAGKSIEDWGRRSTTRGGHAPQPAQLTPARRYRSRRGRRRR